MESCIIYHCRNSILDQSVLDTITDRFLCSYIEGRGTLCWGEIETQNVLNIIQKRRQNLLQDGPKIVLCLLKTLQGAED